MWFRYQFPFRFFCIHKYQKEVACNDVLFNNIYKPLFVSLEQKNLDFFYSMFEQIKVEMQNAQLAQYELLFSFLKIFLIIASKLKVNQIPKAQQDFANLKDAIEKHYKTKHSANEYALLLNISSKALAKTIKVHFKKTLTNLISERIIIEAKRELYLTSKTVKEIAYELGYEDEYYFSRFFKNNANVSPQLF